MLSTRHRLFALAATLLMLLTAAALVPALAAHADSRPEDLQIEQAWIRWLPANLPAGGYLTVANRGGRAVVLVGASSPDYAGVGLHRSVIQGGLSKMQPVERIVIAPHSTLAFRATGYHLMLTTPTRPVAPGARVPITLHFADGRSLVVNFEVRKPDASGPAAMPSMPGMPGMPSGPARPARASKLDRPH